MQMLPIETHRCYSLFCFSLSKAKQILYELAWAQRQQISRPFVSSTNLIKSCFFAITLSFSVDVCVLHFALPRFSVLERVCVQFSRCWTLNWCANFICSCCSALWKVFIFYEIKCHSNPNEIHRKAIIRICCFEKAIWFCARTKIYISIYWSSAKMNRSKLLPTKYLRFSS